MTTLDLTITGLRSAKGNLLICLTRDPNHFPDCTGDPAARKLIIPATAAQAHFADLPAGDYAVSLIHDENENGKLDTTLGIPREGFGFSRNPHILFGPPGFTAAAFTIGAAPVKQAIRLKYML